MERSRRQRVMEGLLLDGTVWFKCYCTKENLVIQPKHGQKLFEQSLASSFASSFANVTANAVLCNALALALITEKGPTHTILNNARNPRNSYPSSQ
jgi:hypothetical protein